AHGSAHLLGHLKSSNENLVWIVRTRSEDVTLLPRSRTSVGRCFDHDRLDRTREQFDSDSKLFASGSQEGYWRDHTGLRLRR
ncbi:hypothetical protein C6A85_22405, partial [Mycobacterium sp. ITM-2017-0098]